MKTSIRKISEKIKVGPLLTLPFLSPPQLLGYLVTRKAQEAKNSLSNSKEKGPQAARTTIGPKTVLAESKCFFIIFPRL